MMRNDLPNFLCDLESALKNAQLNSDLRKLDELISDDLLFIGPGGSLFTKVDDLASHASGAVSFRENETIDVPARRISSNAWFVVHRAQLTVMAHGSITSGDYAYSRVWVSESDGFWRVRCGHLSAWSSR